MKIAKTYALYSILILSFALILMTTVWFSKKTQEHSQVIAEQKSVFERFEAVLKLESKLIKKTVFDYSMWDEFVEFVHTPDSSWSKENLEPIVNTFKVSYLFVLDRSKKEVYHYQLPHEERLKIDFSSLNLEQTPFKEFFLVQNGKFIQFFLAPIHYSSDLERHGEPMGYFLVGRIMDDQFFQEMEHITLGKAALMGNSVHKNDENHFHVPLHSFHDELVGHIDFSYTPAIILFMAKLQNSFLMVGFFVILFTLLCFYLLTQSIIFIPIRRISMALKTHHVGYIQALARQPHELGEIAHLIAKHEKQKQLLQHYKEAIDENTIVSRTTPTGIITYVNDQFVAISGYSKEELLGKPHNIIRHPSTPASFFKTMWAVLKAGKTWKGIIKNQQKNGTAYYVKSAIIPLFDERGDIQEYIAIRYDVSELFEQVEHLKKEKLIELPSRATLLKAIENKTLNPHLAIINICGFRDINTLQGQTFGDLYLQHFAIKLTKFLPIPCQLFHLQGDEFALFCDNEALDQTFNDQCASLFTELTREGLFIENKPYPLAIRIGIANGENYLYNRAEIALKEARDAHKSIVVYDDNEGFSQRLQKDIQWNETLRDALQHNRFTIFLQEIVALHVKTPERKKYEVLIRLIDSQGHIITPFHFIDLAKRMHLYDQLTRFVLEEGFRAARELFCDISINITKEDILNHETVTFLWSLFAKYPELKERITLELVESESIEDSLEVRTFLQKARQHGCFLAIDDFGAGYSNFEYLIRLNVDFIKIDGSLIKNLDTDKNAYATVKTITLFAKNLGILVVAEFVHKKEILEKVQELGIDFAQGFYLHEPSSKPMIKSLHGSH